MAVQKTRKYDDKNSFHRKEFIQPVNTSNALVKGA